MSQLVDKLTEAQKYAMSIRPKVKGFPVLAEVLRQAGVQINRWTLPSCQALYIFAEGSVVQQGTPIVNGKEEVPKFNQEALIKALRDDQEGRTVFPVFLTEAWKAGVIAYDVDFAERKVTYYGANNEFYEEDYSAAEVKD